MDTFLLRCRVLGRGVEHQMLARLGKIAAKRGLSRIEIAYLSTPKNQPGLGFLDSVGLDYKSPIDNGFLFSFPTEYAIAITYTPSAAKSKSSSESANKTSSDILISGQQIPDIQVRSGRQNHIAANLNSTEQILEAVASQTIKQRPDLQIEYVAPDNELERSIARIWQQVLGIEKVGIHDNFAEIGGSSLQGVQLIAQLRKSVNMDISIVNLFENPTISSMARMLGQGGEADQRHKDIHDRSQRRREKIRSRKARRMTDG